MTLKSLIRLQFHSHGSESGGTFLPSRMSGRRQSLHRLGLVRSTSRDSSYLGIVLSSTGSNALYARSADSPERNLTGTGLKVCVFLAYLGLDFNPLTFGFRC